jgi:peptide chain release factor 1
VIEPLVVVVMRSCSAHVGRERRLITHRRRNTAEQRRHFRTRLGEAEDVVDEEQHVLALVAEVFRDGQTGERDAGAGARRFVHLAEHESALRAFAAALLVDVGFDELVIEVVALAGTLADAGEHRVTAVGLRDVVDQFLNEHGLADAGAAEQADLAALGVRARAGRRP